MPYASTQHAFNLQGVWLFRVKENLTIQSNKFFDYNNFLNFSKKDFNAILVGYYPLNEYELKLIKYAEKEGWNFFYITNFKIFVRMNAIKNLIKNKELSNLFYNFDINFKNDY